MSGPTTSYFLVTLTDGVDEATLWQEDLVADPDDGLPGWLLTGQPSWVFTALAAGTLQVSVTLTGYSTAPLETGLRVSDVYLSDKGGSIISRPVCRQFPRDDVRGFGSSPRLFPPPKGGRVVGGYQ